jgi:hypothetical protein
MFLLVFLLRTHRFPSFASEPGFTPVLGYCCEMVRSSMSCDVRNAPYVRSEPYVPVNGANGKEGVP